MRTVRTRTTLLPRRPPNHLALRFLRSFHIHCPCVVRDALCRNSAFGHSIFFLRMCVRVCALWQGIAGGARVCILAMGLRTW
jgi:hypothetical protein